MFWKRKAKEHVSPEAPALLAKVAIRFNGQLIKWSAYLQQKSMQLSPKKLKMMWGLFFLILTACSAYVIIYSLREKPQPFRITAIRAMPPAKSKVEQPFITEKEFIRFQRLRLSLDSLAETPSGKRRLDSILEKHPKLLDTLYLLESIYHNQSKN